MTIIIRIKRGQKKSKRIKQERKKSIRIKQKKKKATEKNILTINTDGSIILKISDDVKIPSDSITRVSDTNYTTSYNDSNSINVKLTLIFSSDTEGKLMMESEGESGKDLATIDITKK